MTTAENIAELWQQLLDIGITNKDSRQRLAEGITRGDSEFPVMDVERFGRYLLSYIVTVKYGDQAYYLDNIQFAQTNHQIIAHVTYRGIDTSILEDKMEAIDWESPKIMLPDLTTGQGGITDPLNREVTKICRQLQVLLGSGDTLAIGAALQLQFNHWALTRFGNMAKVDSPNIFYRLDLSQYRFSLEQLATLADGRAICRRQFTVPDGETFVWYQFSSHVTDSAGHYVLQAFADFDLHRQLSIVRFLRIGSDTAAAEQKLRDGRSLFGFSNGGPCYVSVDAAARQLTFHIHGNGHVPLPPPIQPLWANNRHKRSTDRVDGARKTRKRKKICLLFADRMAGPGTVTG